MMSLPINPMRQLIVTQQARPTNHLTLMKPQLILMIPKILMILRIIPIPMRNKLKLQMYNNKII